MSEGLMGRVPELEEGHEQTFESLVQNVPTLLITLEGRNNIPMIGALRAVLADARPELEARVTVDDALDIVTHVSSSLRVSSYEIHCGERVETFEGPFEVKSARMQEIDVPSQQCTLLILLSPTLTT